ncbi:MAG: hypothetical protein KGJ13_10115, partial [Patescibacteria group bacterium]|nr:hypothetical protein [Patescibacteria group bacterium]
HIYNLDSVTHTITVQFVDGASIFTLAQVIVPAGNFLRYGQETGWQVGTVLGPGTVTSVGLTMPAEFTVTGSPVTSAGILTVAKATQAANTFYAGPASGVAATPTFRTMSVNNPVGWGFTAGSIPFMTSTGIAQDSGNFFFDVSSHTMTLKQGRIIIDGTNANQIFQFNSSGVVNSWWGVGNAILGGLLSVDAGTIVTGLGSYVIATNSVERLRVDQTGKVGIGTTSPLILLDVNGPIGAKVYTVATLPSAVAKAGQFAFVSDATQTAAAGIGTIVAGGGANFVPVYSDGTNWKII